MTESAILVLDLDKGLYKVDFTIESEKLSLNISKDLFINI